MPFEKGFQYVKYLEGAFLAGFTLSSSTKSWKKALDHLCQHLNTNTTKLQLAMFKNALSTLWSQKCIHVKWNFFSEALEQFGTDAFLMPPTTYSYKGFSSNWKCRWEYSGLTTVTQLFLIFSDIILIATFQMELGPPFISFTICSTPVLPIQTDKSSCLP